MFVSVKSCKIYVLDCNMGCLVSIDKIDMSTKQQSFAFSRDVSPDTGLNGNYKVLLVVLNRVKLQGVIRGVN